MPSIEERLDNLEERLDELEEPKTDGKEGSEDENLDEPKEED